MNKQQAISGPAMRWGFALPVGQVAPLFIVLGIGLSLILATVQVGLLATMLIYTFVCLVGLQQSYFTQRKLDDPKLRLLGYFWLIKLSLTLFLLYVGWIPQLDQSTSTSWGYDPQRFYYDAFNLIENGWSPTGGSNYQGIIYYYGFIFYLFGHNPVIPALINAFVTLLGTLYLIRIAYEFKEIRSPRDWMLAYLILIPELLWYDVMTSRETLMAVLILVAMLSAGRYIVRLNRVSTINAVLLTSTCLGVILAVRTSMAITVVVSIILMALLLSPGRRTGFVPKFLMVSLVVALLLGGPIVQQLAGGSNVDYLILVSRMQSFENNVASSALNQWSENSIGLLLSPDNVWQALLYLPARMLLYLVTPLPNVAISLSDLIAGSWSAWQRLMTIPNSLLNILGLPYVLVGFAGAYKRRARHPAPLVFYIGFWIMFVSIAGGNIVIHERYRVMMTLLLFACAWLGYTSCTRSQVRTFAVYWYGLLIASAFFYISYKWI